MTDLSLRQYMQQKETASLRSCAPSLKDISMRTLLKGIDRRIIHLSDLHIGINNSNIPANQVQEIVNAIIKTYPKQNETYENPRPIIVITGDLVDYYSPANLATAYNLLNQLTQAGFTVLAVPGNHDYSDSFSTSSFTKLNDIPGVGDLITLAANVANDFIGKGQDPNLMSGMTYIPQAETDFKAKIAPYFNNNGYYIDSWKNLGAVYDLDFILVDGQDPVAYHPDWDDPKRWLHDKVHEAVATFNYSAARFYSLFSHIFNIDQQSLADSVANAVSDAITNMVLDPVLVHPTVFATVITVEKTVFEPFKDAAIAIALGSGIPELISIAITGDIISDVLDFGLAAAVADVAVAWILVPLDDKFFLHDGSFRLAHGFLDVSEASKFVMRLNQDNANKTLPIPCLHYWINYPKMDTQYNAGTDSSGTPQAMNNLVNEKPNTWQYLDASHLLMVGHIHINGYGHVHTFQTSTRNRTLPYYSRAGSTFPDPESWQDDYLLNLHKAWLELTINLNTGIISQPYVYDVKGNRSAIIYDQNRLQPGRRLNVNEQLVSNNGWFKLIMQVDGNLVLYRTQINNPLWLTDTAGKPVTNVNMQRDGCLVALTSDGTIYWSSNTSGHPDAQLCLKDNGSLVIEDTFGQNISTLYGPLDSSSPTIRYTDINGYQYDETSESWKEMCRSYPCFAALNWTGYDTKIIRDTINGYPVVIQLWKGTCQQFLGMSNFPGGIGAEVGIYRIIPGKAKSDLSLLLTFLPNDVANFIYNRIQPLADNDLRWPFPELNASIEFNLINPITNQTFFSAGAETSYWLAKWMETGSYDAYQQNQGKSNIPGSATDYILEYKINGKSYDRW